MFLNFRLLYELGLDVIRTYKNHSTVNKCKEYEIKLLSSTQEHRHGYRNAVMRKLNVNEKIGGYIQMLFNYEIVDTYYTIAA